jgi:NADPH:quinone reductase-like Zn-dependent oxidoreductase
MKAALLTAYGDVDKFVIEDVAVPEPGPGEVLLKIEASAVNPFDLILRQGYVAAFIPLPMPAILGGDAAGTIAKLGEGVTGLKVGDRVIADFATDGRGSYAEYGVVPVTALAKLPDALSFEQGAALPKAGLMGRQAVEALGVKAGDRVLVSGALGSVGRAAIQYLKEIGAVPVAGVRAERLEEARQLAGEAIDLGAPPAAPAFDYAISTAPPVVETVVANVRDGGQVASIVQAPEGLNADNRVTIHQLFHRTDAATLDAVAKAAATGDLVIPIAQVLPLEKVGEAQAAVAAGARGKVVLKH